MAAEILSYDEYARIIAGGLEHPYLYELGSGEHRLLFYGSEHLEKPPLDHPQFADIEQHWDTFIRSVARPLLDVEGHFDQTPESETHDRAGAITTGGEQGFAVHLARRDGVPIVSSEPDRAEEAEALAGEFGHEAVMLYYYLRQLGGWYRSPEPVDLPSAAADMLGKMHDILKWDDLDFSMTGMQELYRKTFGGELDSNDIKLLEALVTPIAADHITNRVSRLSGELRDAYISTQAIRHWRAGQSPFMVYGSSHAICQEPVLREQIGS